MARWATTIEVAGVSFTGCRGEILDGWQFATPYSGSIDTAADGTPHPQVVNRGVKGLAFGLQLASAQIATILEALEAINDAIAAQEAFAVRLADGLFDIDVVAHVDYSQQWFAPGKESEGWVEGVTFRFVSAGVNV